MGCAGNKKQYMSFLSKKKKINNRINPNNPVVILRSRWPLTRINQSLYYALAGRYINAWMHSLKKSVKPEIVNRYDLWVLRHKIGGAKVFVNNVQWSDQMM